MIEYHNLYLPKSKKEVKIEVSVPRDYSQSNTTFDTLYYLDGQNAFKDSHATYRRSIRASKHMGSFADNTEKRMIGVAIYNAGSEMGRINEYAPFKITYLIDPEWKKHDVKICHTFCEDFIRVIIPYIDQKYPTNQHPENRFIYGSSLSALTAIYLGYNFPKVFGAIGAFSTANFLFPKELISFLNKKATPQVKLFLYVGKTETSDGSQNENLYYQSNLELYNECKKLNLSTRLLISSSGTHNEACWEKQLYDFFSFIYFDNMIYKS